MEIESGWTELQTAGGTCSAFRARPVPAQTPLPGVLVIQEVWGVDAHIQDLSVRFAAAGYLALAPDLYTVGTRQPELDPARIAGVKAFLERVPPAVWTDPAKRAEALSLLPDAERDQVAGTMAVLFGQQDPERNLQTLADAASALQNDPVCSGSTGCVGWCMGGNLSARLAARDAALAAAVIFYGSPPSAEEVPEIGCPVLGFYGADDLRITSSVPAFAEAMRVAGRSFEAHVYPGAPHAFFNDTRRSYRSDAARDAWARCLVFFASYLDPIAS
jgi:carboxymethylenebutenolidase